MTQGRSSFFLVLSLAFLVGCRLYMTWVNASVLGFGCECGMMSSMEDTAESVVMIRIGRGWLLGRKGIRAKLVVTLLDS